MLRHLTRRAGLSGWTAGLLLVSFGLAPAWEAAHLLFVRHTVCAVHGELVEGASSDARAVEAVVGWSAARPEEHESADHHDHCAVITARTFAPARPSKRPDLIAPAVREGAAPHVLTPAIRHPGIAVLQLAPKGSPPAPAAPARAV